MPRPRHRSTRRSTSGSTMSSATSTEKPSRSGRVPAERGADAALDRADAGLQPWQFFVLAALGCATAITFVARGQGPTAIVLLGVLIAGAALVPLNEMRTR